MIYGTDKFLSEIITVSAKAKLKDAAMVSQMFRFLDMNMDLILAHFEFELDPIIRLCHIPGYNHFGMCYGSDDKSSTVMIDVRCNDFDEEELLESLCHELVHSKQWERGDFRREGTETIWRDQISIREAIKNANTLSEYQKLPWEAEAYEQQSIFAKSIISHKKYCTS